MKTYVIPDPVKGASAQDIAAAKAVGALSSSAVCFGSPEHYYTASGLTAPQAWTSGPRKMWAIPQANLPGNMVAYITIARNADGTPASLNLTSTEVTGHKAWWLLQYAANFYRSRPSFTRIPYLTAKFMPAEEAKAMNFGVTATKGNDYPLGTFLMGDSTGNCRLAKIDGNWRLGQSSDFESMYVEYSVQVRPNLNTQLAPIFDPDGHPILVNMEDYLKETR